MPSMPATAIIIHVLANAKRVCNAGLLSVSFQKEIVWLSMKNLSHSNWWHSHLNITTTVDVDKRAEENC